MATGKKKRETIGYNIITKFCYEAKGFCRPFTLVTKGIMLLFICKDLVHKERIYIIMDKIIYRDTYIFCVRLHDYDEMLYLPSFSSIIILYCQTIIVIRILTLIIMILFQDDHTIIVARRIL